MQRQTPKVMGFIHPLFIHPLFIHPLLAPLAELNTVFWSSAVEAHKACFSGECVFDLAVANNPQQAARQKPEGLSGRVLTGYQGWFRAEGDGSGMGWAHYSRRGRFEPGSCSVDLWPDLSEFGEQEKYATPFRHRAGQVAHVFSSINPATVNRHFDWMKQFNIDGAFVQRFGVHAGKVRRDYRQLKFDNLKLLKCRDAAIKHQRCYALMYDLSGLANEDFDRLAEDWKQLRRKMELGTDPADSAYLQFNGKPLVAIWGVGFNDNRQYDLEKCEWLIRLMKHNPEWGGFSIMLGVPYYWREQTEDATDDPQLHSVLKLADVISPWSVGRYRTPTDARIKITNQQTADLTWCQKKGIHYLPVLFPGFRWENMNPKDESTIPRLKGRFFWQQFLATATAGNQSAYVAMFDEIDEGTAIFKCTNDPPVGKSAFGTFEGLPSDHYLWLTREGKRILRGDLPSRDSTER